MPRVSRLQKLLNLLENGTSDATRKAAAKQIADIAKVHPEQLPSIVRKVSAHLYHKTWETRVAAGEALGLLADHFAHISVRDLATCCQPANSCGADAGVSLTFKSFNLQHVLEKGSALLASGGQEFDIAEDPSITPKQRIEKMRQQLKKRLGLDRGMEGIMDTDELLQDDDIDVVVDKSKQHAASANKQQASELLQHMEGLSARERNKLKRKAKALGRSDSARPVDSRLQSAPAPGVAAEPSGAQKANEDASCEQDEEEWRAILAGAWPFQRLSDQLCVDILDPCWEVRHGAAVALREVLRSHAACAAVQAPLSDQAQGWCSPGGTGKRPLDLVSPEVVQAAREANESWLEDCLVLLLCVLALDRFGDYGSDQVTAPVRETAAQALGMALQPMDLGTVQCVVQLMQQLMEQPLWDVRCGGYLGLKYTLAGRLDLGKQLLQDSLPSLLAGLQDSDDDVRAASADALVPLAPVLFELGAGAVRAVRSLLWQLLVQLEELSPATMSVMALLAQLYGSGAAKAGALANGAAGASDAAAGAEAPAVGMEDELGQLVPRLFLFLRHSMSAVRLSTVQCLERLLLSLQQQQQAAVSSEATSTWLQPVLTAMALLTFQNLLVESDERVLTCTMRVWQLLLECSSAAELLASNAATLLHTLLRLAATPNGLSFDLSSMCGPCLDAESGSIQMMPLSELAAREAAAAEAKDKAARSSTAATAVAPRKRAKKGASTDAGGSGSVGGAAAGAAAARRAELTVGASGGESSAVRMRLVASEALGQLVHKVHGHDDGLLLGEVVAGLQGTSGYLRFLSALVLWHWHGLRASQQQPQLPADNSMEAVALGLLHQLLCSPGPTQPHLPLCADPYSEAQCYYEHMRREAIALATACLALGHVLCTPNGMPVNDLNPDHALAVVASLPEEVASAATVAPAAQRVRASATSVQSYEVVIHLQVVAACASAAVRAGPLPAKLNQVIQPLMNALRTEAEPVMQALHGSAIAELMLLCATRSPCPNDKLVRNICNQACSDPSETPNAAQAAEQARQQQQLEERQQSHRAAGPRSAAAAGSSGATATQAAEVAAAVGVAIDAAHNPNRTKRLGAEAALKCIAGRFGARLWEQLPGLWSLISAPIMAAAAVLDPGAAQAPGAAAPPADAAPADVQQLVNALQVLKVTAPHVSKELLPSLASLLPALVACSRHDNAVVRAGCAKCLASITAAWLDDLMPPLLRLLVPLLGSADEATRLGAVEASAALVSNLGFRLVAYAVLIVVPLLRRMSDASEAVRRCATACFGALVALLPLAQGMPAPAGLDAEQLACMAHDSALVSQLLDNRQVEDFSVPPCLELPVTLRPYQQEGINWLAFLRRFGLHGVLADDMGLGKTLQASCIMGASAVEEWDTYARAMSGAAGPAAAVAPAWPRPCLVVCPSTLVAHWCHEVKRYVSPKALRPVQYQGTPVERTRQQAQLAPSLLPPGAPGALASPHGPDGTLHLPQYNLVVMSYEALRADVDWVVTIPWLYCVLDEGHVIKSPKARITIAVKRVPAAHRLLLSGTPIQNNVLELWSLFDFLMPGFLGSEREFNAKYGKAVQAARYSKRGSRELEVGLLAVEALHKQVMPFVLRRTKAQVLQDLPPKIIQDIFCDMSPLQMRLYEDFQKSSAPQEVVANINKQREADVQGGGGGGGQVLRALLYLRKLCSHPELVLDWKTPEHRQAVLETLGLTDASEVAAALKDVEVAPKLAALRDLLAQCGVISMQGAEDASASEADEGSDGSGHRLLVFAQMKGMLDLVERDVLLPSGVSFLRLDGSMEPNSRFSVVQRFNSDPTIDVLLLTTSVGGLGLNLTSADTVVFLEHDWNPSKDLQAMDRAHRLGQTRTVNVYRLLMRNTLEEKVMSLQQFKTDMANAVVNQDNISLKEMDTTQLLDLFGTSGQQQGTTGAAAGTDNAAAAAKKQSGLQAMLSSLGDLWDESQYTSEFSLSAYMSKVSGKKGQ